MGKLDRCIGWKRVFQILPLYILGFLNSNYSWIWWLWCLQFRRNTHHYNLDDLGRSFLHFCNSSSYISNYIRRNSRGWSKTKNLSFRFICPRVRTWFLITQKCKELPQEKLHWSLYKSWSWCDDRRIATDNERRSLIFLIRIANWWILLFVWPQRLESHLEHLEKPQKSLIRKRW